MTNTIDAILTLNGQHGIPVRMLETATANGKQFDLLDANGHVLQLPAGVTLDGSTMTVRQNGAAVGSIAPVTLHVSDPGTGNPDDTLHSTSGGVGTGAGTTAPATPPSVDTPASPASTDAPAADPGDSIEPTTTGKRVTKTLPDGMWRPAVAKTDTGGAGSGDGTGGGDGLGGGDDGSGLGGADGGGSSGDPALSMIPGDPNVDNFGGGGGGAGANGSGGGDGTTTDTDFGTADYEGALGPATNGTGSSSQQQPSSGGGAGAAISMIGTGLGALAALSHWMNWAKEGGSLAKGLGILGVIGGGIGAFFAFKGLGEKFSAMSVVNASVAVTTFIYSWQVAHPFGLGMGWGIGIMAAMAAAAFAIGKHGTKTNNDLDTSKGDVGQYPTWANYMPTVNQFTILAGISSLAIGINLAGSGPSFQSVAISSSKLSAVNAQLASATGNAFQGNSPQAALGKVFIKPMGNTSKVVFVEPDPQKPESYRVDMVTLNDGGYVTGQAKAVKELQMTPFFFVEKKTGAITPNPEAARQLNVQNAMAATANSGQIGGASAARAAQIGAMQGHQGVDYYSSK